MPTRPIDMDEIRKDPAQVRTLQAHFRRAVGMISGRWKLEILYLLSFGTRRFGELKRGLPGITQHMLTAQLRALERDGRVMTRGVVERISDGYLLHVESQAVAGNIQRNAQ